MDSKSRATVAFILNNFGPLIVFYAANHFLGLKVAVISSMVFIIGEIVFRYVRNEKVSTLFKFTALMSMIFGAVDLYASQSLLFKYEAAVTNVITAGFFAASLFSERSIIQEFYEKQANAKPINEAKLVYFRWLTLVWIAYFLVKSAAYVWIAQNYSLEQGLVIRTIVGSASFYVLLAISIFGSKKIFPFLQSRGLIPSQAIS